MSTTANDGGPAFPSDTHVGWTDQGAPIRAPGDRGMSLRDYFAASAQDQIAVDADPALTAKACGVEIPSPRSTPSELNAFWLQCEAILRYRFADAMLRAREASNG